MLEAFNLTPLKQDAIIKPPNIFVSPSLSIQSKRGLLFNKNLGGGILFIFSESRQDEFNHNSSNQLVSIFNYIHIIQKKEIKMSLAQVVYNITTDNEFAAQWQLDPETALAERGLQLSREELAFLSTGIRNSRNGSNGKVRLSELALLHRGWM